MHHGKILKDLVNEIANEKGMTRDEFAEKLGMSRQNLYSIYGKEVFDDKFILQLEKAGVVNAKKVFTRGMGSDRFMQVVQNLPRRTDAGVPYLGDLDIFAGAQDISNADLSEYITEYISIPGFKEAKYYVNVRGNSMYSKYAAGDIIAIKDAPNMNEIQFGQVYVVITNDNRVLKYVRKGKDDKYLKLVSENPKFDDMEVERKNIRAMFLVLGKITKDVL